MLPVGLPPLVCMKGLVEANGKTHVLPLSGVVGVPSTDEASVGGEPSLSPLPPVLSICSVTAPAESATARLNEIVMRLTCDRCADPSPAMIVRRDGGSLGITVNVQLETRASTV